MLFLPLRTPGKHNLLSPLAEAVGQAAPSLLIMTMQAAESSSMRAGLTSGVETFSPVIRKRAFLTWVDGGRTADSRSNPEIG